jgi:hypothetical protein
MGVLVPFDESSVLMLLYKSDEDFSIEGLDAGKGRF